MKKVIYLVIRAESYVGLEERVQNKLDDGWELQGGISSIQIPENAYHDYIVFQAMTLKADTEQS